jgi:hypothetical protein
MEILAWKQVLAEQNDPSETRPNLSGSSDFLGGFRVRGVLAFEDKSCVMEREEPLDEVLVIAVAISAAL